MSDLINKQALLEKIGKLPQAWGYKQGVEDCLDIINDTPTIDAVPVVHAMWNDNKCTKCGCDAPDDGFWYSPYCPGCGARMDGEAE